MNLKGKGGIILQSQSHENTKLKIPWKSCDKVKKDWVYQHCYQYKVQNICDGMGVNQWYGWFTHREGTVEAQAYNT